MAVRFAEFSDLDSIIEVVQKAPAPENSMWTAPMIRDDIEHRRLLFDEDTRGILSFYARKTPPLRVTVYNLTVPRDQRRRGGGTRLMVTLSYCYPDREVYLKCPEIATAALEFYTSLGMSHLETLLPEGRRKATLWVFSWPPLGSVLPPPWSLDTLPDYIHPRLREEILKTNPEYFSQPDLDAERTESIQVTVNHDL